jgi:hypothetical protein
MTKGANSQELSTAIFVDCEHVFNRQIKVIAPRGSSATLWKATPMTAAEEDGNQREAMLVWRRSAVS